MSVVAADVGALVPSAKLGRCRAALLLIVVVATAIKLVIASTTFGTGDVATWMRFAKGVSLVGPVSVYKLNFVEGHRSWLYNHPPLIGYLLMLMNLITRWGVPFQLGIRIPSIVADAITPFLVFGLLRKRRTLRLAFAASALVAVSPVLFVVSGFHGNTDSVFVMLSVFSLYLLVDRRSPILAGLAIGVAISVKIVPVVLVPTLLAFAVLQGWRFFSKFVIGAGAFIAVVWGPVILRAWAPFEHHVLGYTGGMTFRSWGLVQLGKWAGNKMLTVWLPGPGRFVVVLIASLVPAVLVFRRQDHVVEAAGLAMCVFLVLSPAFATQYLAWVIAPAYLIGFWSATAYNLAAGALVVEIYNRWSGGFPWYYAAASRLTQGEVWAALLVWVTLIAVVAEGIRRALLPSIVTRAPTRSRGHGSAAADQ